MPLERRRESQQAVGAQGGRRPRRSKSSTIGDDGVVGGSEFGFVSRRIWIIVVGMALRYADNMRLKLNRRPKVDCCQAREHQGQREVPRFGPPTVQVIFDVEDALQGKANAPENSHVTTESPS